MLDAEFQTAAECRGSEGPYADVERSKSASARRAGLHGVTACRWSSAPTAGWQDGGRSRQRSTSLSATTPRPAHRPIGSGRHPCKLIEHRRYGRFPRDTAGQEQHRELPVEHRRRVCSDQPSPRSRRPPTTRTHYPQFLAQLQAGVGSLPAFVKQEFDDYLNCGLLGLAPQKHLLARSLIITPRHPPSSTTTETSQAYPINNPTFPVRRGYQVSGGVLCSSGTHRQKAGVEPSPARVATRFGHETMASRTGSPPWPRALWWIHRSPRRPGTWSCGHDGLGGGFCFGTTNMAISYLASVTSGELRSYY
jgi:hypothetical protein